MTEGAHHSIFYVKVNGTPVETEMFGDVIGMEVDDSLHMPTMITIELNDKALKWVDTTTMKVGDQLILSASTVAGGPEAPLGSAEITAIEAVYRPDGGASVLISALDGTHRLHHTRATETYVQKTDSDIAKVIAGRCGLGTDVDATSNVYEQVFQDNQTDFDFLKTRARRIGYVLRVHDKKLVFKKLESLAGDAGTFEWGKQLLSFRTRVTGTGQHDGVIVQGWDPKEKRAVVGQASRVQARNDVGITGINAISTGAIPPGTLTLTNVPVATQSEAQAIATAMMNETRHGDLFVEGEVVGTASLKVGHKMTVRNVGTRFSGSYLLTRVQHRYDVDRGWITRFEASNGTSASITGIVGEEAGKISSRSPNAGPVVGIVTNNNDPEKQGRVKVKYPWLSEQKESNWARFVAPMTGSSRGVQFIPEVNDEVLVAFEHGDFDRPYVLGSLWNGRDKPPAANYVQGGKVVVREIQTTAGHIIRLTDTAGSEKIEVIDKTTKNKITIDSVKNEIDIEADMKVMVKAKEIALDAQLKLTGKATNIEMTASAGMKLDGGPMTEIKGGLIKLN